MALVGQTLPYLAKLPNGDFALVADSWRRWRSPSTRSELRKTRFDQVRLMHTPYKFEHRAFSS